MAIPTAIVKIELLTLKSLASATPGAGNTRYARAIFKAGSAPPVTTGRSRPIPDAGGTFDLTAEAVPWQYEVAVNPGTDINISVQLDEDHGDLLPPPPIASNFISGKISDPWTSGQQTVGGGPTVDVRVTTKIVKTSDAAFLARAKAAAGVSGKLTIPQAFFVEIVSIDGLYQPDILASPPNPGSKKVAGYISEDNLGRIFTNRKPDGSWAHDTQFIDVAVRVTAVNGAKLPAGAKVDWTIDDVDDPTNDDSAFHREWGRYVDPNDYDPGTGAPIGAHAGDNAGAFSPGNADDNKLFSAAAQGNARWDKATGGPATAPSSRNNAQTPITPTSKTVGTSSVRIHCTNVLGTNFVLRVGLKGTPAAIPVFKAFTGVMTMWSRLDVEVVRMAGAHSVAGTIGSIPEFFLPVCVQLDFQSEKSVSGALDKAEMAADDSLLTSASIAWVNDPGVFTNKANPGWFFLGAARLSIPHPGAGPTPPVFDGTSYTLGTTGTDVWIEVSGSFPNADYVDITWTDAAGAQQNVGFGVDTSTVTAGKTRVFLRGNDVTPGFTGFDADGSIAHAVATLIFFFPQHSLPAGAAALVAGGFGVPNAGAKVKIFPPGRVATSGISPPVPNAVTGTGKFFAGRTILFTHHGKFSTGSPPAPRPDFNARVLSTVVHEFTHAFGMPHKCGFWNWRTPRIESCSMNYFDTWLLDAAQKPIPGTVGNQGKDLCGRHLMEVRRVHLERNLGLNW